MIVVEVGSMNYIINLYFRQIIHNKKILVWKLTVNSIAQNLNSLVNTFFLKIDVAKRFKELKTHLLLLN